MKKINCLLLLTFWVFQMNASGQSISISELLKTADSVIVISHKLIKGGTVVMIDSNRKTIELPSLLRNDDLNHDVILKKLTLTTVQIESLNKEKVLANAKKASKASA